MEYTGGCLCKQVRFRVMAEPIAMRLCWCRLCQYLAAGNATVNVVFPSDALSVEGELTDKVMKDPKTAVNKVVTEMFKQFPGRPGAKPAS